ncbi:FMN-dependent NADH-azoreductase [Chitinophaga sp. GCM10012297]|uniref:FMN dependent NADH:quinone oxidoreductase n=1 Tax=Chitinophaga chungangae TaxID=2821488 RepID=A0ABS3YLS3_9BACT|nr:NAD(P)H-dependent oxidoreductase [Chitinophaga chungangae]MBO9155198.1 NAD(P)H-dependent oxidoreductase [Chitinophaga chungangae]
MKILHLISSPKQEGSFSVQLGNDIVAKLQSKYPGSTVVTRNLGATPFPHLEEVHFTSFFTPAEARTDMQVNALKHSDEAVAQLMEADIIVIGVPVYNFAIHSSLKTWIDHVVRAGVTFKYGENGPEGLVNGKKVYLAISSGGVFSDDSRNGLDFSEPYLKAILGFIGLKDITTYRVEGLAIPGVKERALERAVEAVAV